MTVYAIPSGRAVAAEDIDPAGLYWVDLLHPTEEEIAVSNRRLGLELPTRPEMEEIEPTSRLYVEKDAIFVTATVLANADQADAVTTGPVSFVLTPRFLVTLRYIDNQSFRLFRSRLEGRFPAEAKPAHVFSALLDAIVDRLADILERVGLNCDRLSAEIFQAESADRRADRQTTLLRELLRRTGQNSEILNKIRESLVSLNRLHVYSLEPIRRIGKNSLTTHMKGIGRDVQALTDHAHFLDGKIAFYLDAILGLISIEQNQIIKIFSIAAVIFLPPTVVASMYGMNFKFMPGLETPLGFPLSLVLMLASAVLPYWFFRKKGWI